MMLTDREWLRFVTFALAAGGVLGSSYTAALSAVGRTPVGALVGGVIGMGVLAVLFHLAIRYLLDRATKPPTTDEPAEETA